MFNVFEDAPIIIQQMAENINEQQCNHFISFIVTMDDDELYVSCIKVVKYVLVAWALAWCNSGLLTKMLLVRSPLRPSTLRGVC